MAHKITHEQRDLLGRMAALCGGNLIEQTRKLADDGNDEANALLVLWEFWERYESRLTRERQYAPGSVTVMIGDASKAISNMEVRA